MIRVQNLRKAYGNTPVLRDVTVQVETGVICGIAGPNASGKSTLIKTLLGLVLPDHGQIWIDGELINSHSDYRNKIGFMPQAADFPGNLRPAEYFELLQALRRRRVVGLGQLLQDFELDGHLTKPFGKLSAGTRQKVAAVGALMFEAPLLVLDEPTAGLDPIASNTLKLKVKQAAERGTTVVIVSHIMSELEQIARNLIFLLDGAVLFSGEVDELRRRSGKSELEECIVGLISGRKERGSA